MQKIKANLKANKALWIVICVVVLFAIGVFSIPFWASGSGTTPSTNTSETSSNQTTVAAATTDTPTPDNNAGGPISTATVVGACGSNCSVTQAPTQAPTTTSGAPIPSAAELSSLFSATDGKVTDVNDNGGGKIALDIQVYNPTQTKIKHINYILMQFFFGTRNDVTLLNFAFHADGYTGMDDPIAQCGGVASEYSPGYGEDQLWDTMAGVFNANLPA